MRYAIVKYASDEYSELHDYDPKVKGVGIGVSAANSYTGQQVGIRESYDESEADLAHTHLQKMIEKNPSVGYALCPILHD